MTVHERSCLKCGHDMSRSRCRVKEAPEAGNLFAVYEVRCGKCRKRHNVTLTIRYPGTRI